MYYWYRWVLLALGGSDCTNSFRYGSVFPEIILWLVKRRQRLTLSVRDSHPSLVYSFSLLVFFQQPVAIKPAWYWILSRQSMRDLAQSWKMISPFSRCGLTCKVYVRTSVFLSTSFERTFLALTSTSLICSRKFSFSSRFIPGCLVHAFRVNGISLNKSLLEESACHEFYHICIRRQFLLLV